MGNIRRIFVDFEFNTISKRFAEAREVTSHEIVEFGAVMVDECGDEIDSFHEYVKPAYADRISAFLKKNSGITMDLLDDKSGFSEVLGRFIDWCETSCSDTNGDDYEIYSWSESDIKQLAKEIALKGITETPSISRMMDNWLDLQYMFDTDLGFLRQQSLERALEMAGMTFVGDAHHALDDARNTARLHAFLNDPEEKVTTIRCIQDALKPKASVTSLGDIADWDSILAKLSFAE